MRANLWLAGAFVVTTCNAPGAQTTPSGSFAVVDVRVFDGVTTQDHETVVVRAGKIAAVGAIKTPEGLATVDGHGRTLLPGLIDAHVHAYPANALSESLALGVTTDLDMFNSPDLVRAAKAREASGKDAGEASIFSAGYLATVPKGHGTEYPLPVPTLTTPGEAQAWVDARLAEGSDYIKIIIDDGTAYGGHIATLDAPTVRALVAAAHKHGKLAVCHVGTYAEAKLCVEAGGDGLAHLFVDVKPDAEFGKFVAAHHAFVVPTLSVLQTITGGPEAAEELADSRLMKALPAADQANLRKDFGHKVGDYSAAVESIHQLKVAGVPILAGTDAPNPGTMFGASMHGELLSLTLAGLTPVEALRAATSAPAKAFRLADRGRIAEGMRADLLLVDGDPTVNITDTRNIVTVWKAGKADDRAAYFAALDNEKAAAEALKNSADRVPGGTLLAGFEDGLKSSVGAGWAVAQDSMMGGSSKAGLAVVPGGAAGTASALEVSGAVGAGFAYPYAGAMLSPGKAPFAPANLSAGSGISFWTKGDGKKYRMLVFTQAGGQMPQAVEFTAPAEWTEVKMPWSDFATSGADVTELMWVGGPNVGPVRFELDEIRLMQGPVKP